MDLRQKLEENVGKRVAIGGVKGGQFFEIGGVVTKEGEEFVLVMNRQVMEQPIGQDPRTGQIVKQRSISPAYKLYPGSIKNEDVVVFRVDTETQEEAMRGADRVSQPLVQAVHGSFLGKLKQ